MQNLEIDLIYLWVDGSDEAWMSKKNAFLGKDAHANTEAIAKARNANNDELKYSLRSVIKNVPWVRKIFIVTDEQKPQWINENHPKITIIDIRQLLPSVALPCYNSVIIEHFLYKIPGLSEHFLYANDDMFFNSAIEPSFFFNSKGQPIVRLQKAPLGKWLNIVKKQFNIPVNIYRRTIHRAAMLVEYKFGTYIAGTPHHNVDAYNKSHYRDVVETYFNDEIMSTIEHHVRNENDVQRIIYLYYLLALKEGEIRYVGRNESCRIRLQHPNFMWFIEKYEPKLFCLNDTHHATDADRARVKPFLEQLFPTKSEFEL